MLLGHISWFQLGLLIQERCRNEVSNKFCNSACTLRTHLISHSPTEKNMFDVRSTAGLDCHMLCFGFDRAAELCTGCCSGPYCTGAATAPHRVLSRLHCLSQQQRLDENSEVLQWPNPDMENPAGTAGNKGRILQLLAKFIFHDLGRVMLVSNNVSILNPY